MTTRAPNDLAARGYDTRLLLWCAALLAGFAYVALVIHGRGNPLHSRAGDNGEFMKLLFAAPFLYFLGPRFTLAPMAEKPGGIRQNLLFFGLPFFVALHFYYLSHISAINFSLTASDFARMGPVAWGVFGMAAVIITALAAYHCRRAHAAGFLPVYLGSLLAFWLFIAAMSWLWRDTHHLHIHHYFFFGAFIPWLRFPDPVTRIGLGIAAGVMVEGIATWGMAPLWHLN